jgi:signal peptidase II
MKFIFLLSLPLYFVDQVTKKLILTHINPSQKYDVMPDFFSFVNVTNTGAAFGSFKGNNTFFIVLSCVALLVVVSLLVLRHAPDFWRDLPLSLLLAGILGNLTDRFLYQHVIDFILVNLHVPLADPWPAFNVADSCICLAVIFFVIHSFFPKPETIESLVQP